MSYTVQQLATLSGVTPRTLRFYDRLGLLSPSLRGKNGYRYYGQEELVRLQQILFYRELDYPLDEIKKMMGHPQFDVVASLGVQKRLLELKKKRLQNIIRTIDRTIDAMTNDAKPTDREMYGALSTSEIEAHKKEAKERWGHTDAYRQSQERAAKLSKEDWKRIQDETDANLRAMVAMLEAGKLPEGPEAQKEVAAHYAGISRFYDCTMQVYRGLADMYLSDQRFGDFYRTYHQDLPEYLSKAMRAFADRNEKDPA